jgi:hypothetical protein
VGDLLFTMNTIADQQYRQKYLKSTLEHALRVGLVAQKVCAVDSSDSKVIKAPYQTAPTTTVQAVTTGTYNVSAWTTTDDSLTVTEMFYSSEHIYDFEDVLSDFNIFAARVDDLTYSVMAKIDQYVLNVMGTDGTGTYTTPVGGFTTAANINIIMSNLLSKVAGYAEVYNGLYLVIENTDVPGFIQAQATNGFSFADAALNNGFMGNYMGVDIYVIRTGTFVTTTIGTRSDLAMSGHRLFGVKNTCTYAAPRGIKYEEKSVSGYTGKEIVVYGYIGAKVWVPKAALTVDITLA